MSFIHSYFTATSEKGYIFLPFFEEMSTTYLGVTTMKKTIALLITLAFLSVISSALSQEAKEEKAITALQSALDKDPGNLNLLSKLGLAFLKKEKYQQAIESLEKSIQLQKMIQRLISIWLLHMERLADTLKSLGNYKKPFN